MAVVWILSHDVDWRRDVGEDAMANRCHPLRRLAHQDRGNHCHARIVAQPIDIPSI